MTVDPSDLSLSTSFDRELSWWRGRSYRYLVIEVAARDEKTTTKRPAHDLAIAIDASSSMASALLLVKQLAKGLINRLGASDKISVISFADEPQTELAQTPATESGKVSAAAAVDGIKIRAGTDFIEGWLAAAEQVAAAREQRPDDFGIIVIASDGKANRGLRRSEDVARYATDLRQRGISTAAVAPGPDCDLSLLMAVDNPEGLQEQFGVAAGNNAVNAIANCLKLTSEVAQNVEIRVTIPPLTEVTVLGTVSSERNGERLVCDLGNLRAGSRRLLVIKTVLPEAEIGAQARFEVELSWTDRSGKRQQIGPLVRSQIFARGRENTPQKRNHGATLIVASQWQRQLLRDLIRFNRQGRLKEAEQYLAQEMKFFERYAHDVEGAQIYLSELRQALPTVHRPWRE
jgi:Ca-activated chloride channel homolog